MTLRVTLTTRGVFIAPGEDTVMFFVYVPAARPVVSMDAVSVEASVPLAGVTDSHAGAVVSAVAVQTIVPTPLLERVTV